jgi:hypothetical protein
MNDIGAPTIALSIIIGSDYKGWFVWLCGDSGAWRGGIANHISSHHG